MTATMEPPSRFCCLCCMYCIFRACSAHVIAILFHLQTVCVHSVLCPSIEVQASSLRLVRCSGLFEVLGCYWCMRMMSRYFDYLFYVDFEASMADQRAQNALGHLQVYYGTYFPRNSISSCTYLWNHVVELVMWYFLFRSNVHLVSVYITTLFTSNMFLSNHLTLHRD